MKIIIVEKNLLSLCGTDTQQFVNVVSYKLRTAVFFDLNIQWIGGVFC
jgi:hypothetical protein